MGRLGSLVVLFSMDMFKLLKVNHLTHLRFFALTTHCVYSGFQVFISVFPPLQRLREINSMIRTGETPTKKRGILLEDGSESPAKRICPENHTALIRRLQDVANDRGSH